MPQQAVRLVLVGGLNNEHYIRKDKDILEESKLLNHSTHRACCLLHRNLGSTKER